MFTNASWIGCGTDMGEVCPEFLTRFPMKKKLKNAELSVTAAGVYEAALNGARVGDFILAPGCTAYAKRLQYQTYDVTELLRADNNLKITVAPGWYRGSISANSGELHSAPCALIAELRISYEDGSNDTFVTNEDWEVRPSSFLRSDLYDGETFDASLEERPAVRAVVTDGPVRNTLIPQEGEKICEHERIKPAALLVSPKGERIIDFGQNLAGYVEFTVNGKKGQRVELSHAEVLDSEGNFYTENYRKAQAKLTYVCRDGEQTFKPHFTFYGFRYIRLDEYPGEAGLDEFTAIAVYSDIRRTGHIECSNPKINKLFSNTLWSQRSNFIDIPTDCPQRDERMGWLGDAQVFAKTAGYNYDVLKFFEKWLRDVRAEQFENGAIPDVVPNFWKMERSSTAWGDAVTIIPWQLYLMYGDDRILSENFDAMKRWVDFITKDTLDEYLWTCGDDAKKLWGKHYGDWLAQDAPFGSYKGSTDDDLVASAFYAHSVSILVKTGRVLGKDMTEYESLHGKITEAFKKRYPNPDTQTAHVLALCFNLTDDREKTARELAEMIRAAGNRLQTGFVGTPYLLHALSENGYAGTAYDLLLQEECPSWLYEVNHGATTIWEHWDGIREDGSFWSSDMNSYNHYAYGSVLDWLYTAAAGIRTVEERPGFESVLIRPIPDRRLDWLEASVDTRAGLVCSKWVCEQERVRYEITVPCPAVVVIDGREHSVEKGSCVFYGRL